MSKESGEVGNLSAIELVIPKLFSINYFTHALHLASRNYLLPLEFLFPVK